MSEPAACSILRIIAIVCVTVGVILTVQTGMAAIMVKAAVADFQGFNVKLPDTTQLSFWAVAAQSTTTIIGLVLYGLSPGLAARVVS